MKQLFNLTKNYLDIFVDFCVQAPFDKAQLFSQSFPHITFRFINCTRQIVDIHSEKSYLDIFVDFCVQVDEHDEGDDAEDDEPAPVEVHGVEGRGPHLGRLQVDLIVERLVRGRVLVVAVDDGGLEEPEFFKSN